MSVSENVRVDPDEAYRALVALIQSDQRLSAEIHNLFLGEQARYEASGLLNYVFVLPTVTADQAQGQNVTFRVRNEDERRLILAAPEKYGIAIRHG
jgi:hypothetical protein